MRFENNVQHLKSSVSGADDADHGTGLPRSSAVSLGVAGKTGLQQKRLVPNACPHVVAAALSWLLAQVLCGFPGYREAMNSALFTRSPTIAKPHLPRRHRRRDCRARIGTRRHSTAISLGGLAGVERRDRILDCRLAVAASPERDIRSAIATLESLDDWMLNDIGIHRGQIEHVVRYGDDS
jgi:hypothetical protein